jgi:Xaa-Pro aminopeptidase
MIISNEPGYYRTGAYGIRIENLVVVSPPAPIAGGDRPMLGFETLTLCPIDRRLIDRDLLSPAEVAWVDAYHARLLPALSPLLDAGEVRWLTAAAAPLG